MVQPRTQRISHILIVLTVMLLAGGAALGLLVQNA